MHKTILVILALLFMPSVALAADGKIYSLHGDVWINGFHVNENTPIHFGDRVLTGAKANIMIVLDENVYRLGSRALFTLPSAQKRGTLSLLYGELLAVFRHNSNKTLYTKTAVLGVRGTGLYLNSKYDETYLCLCYGDVDLTDVKDANNQAHIHAEHHNAIVFNHQSRKVKGNQPLLGHVDHDLYELEALAGRISPESFKPDHKDANRLTF